jgi:O-6-methylguanine DNA methyltransferase
LGEVQHTAARGLGTHGQAAIAPFSHLAAAQLIAKGFRRSFQDWCRDRTQATDDEVRAQLGKATGMFEKRQALMTIWSQVYAIARAIPSGTTLSYGEIAAQLGDSSAAREVGQAMGSNPFPIIVPCHRVLAAGGIMTKLRLLDIEGAQLGGAPTLFESLPLAARPRRR